VTSVPPAVEAAGLKVERGHTLAVDGLDLCAPMGAITAILGPNGAGKTTLARTISTLQPYRGSLKVAGREVAHHPGVTRSLVAVASQHTALPPQHTGREYLRLIGRLRGLRGRERARSVQEVVERLGLAAFADQRLARCSGGQRRRVTLAATLLGQPSVIVLDEPTTGLDPQARLAIWDHLASLREDGFGLVLTTQDLNEATRLADHVVILDRGRSRAAGSLAELREAQRLRRLTIGMVQGSTDAPLDRLAAILGAQVRSVGGEAVVVGAFDLPEVTDAIQRAGVQHEVRELHLQPPTLEEIYRATVEGDEQEVA
jgi:ABC-2 type transport system ATP-binding protein